MGRAYLFKFKTVDEWNEFLSLYRDIFIPYSETTIKEIRRRYDCSDVDERGVRHYHYGGYRNVMTIDDDAWEWLKYGVDFIKWSYYKDDKDEILVSIQMDSKKFNESKNLFKKEWFYKNTNVYVYKGRAHKGSSLFRKDLEYGRSNA